MTERALTAGMLAELSANTVRMAILYDGVFSGGSPTEDQHVRLWTGVGTLSWGGYDWTGSGKLLSITPLEESASLRAVGFAVRLSGMPQEMVALALQSMKQGKAGTLYLAFFDASGALIADPYQLQRGRLDIGVIEDDGVKCVISAQYESRLIDLERPRVRYYTEQDHVLDHAGDTGLRFVPALQDWNGVWG